MFSENSRFLFWLCTATDFPELSEAAVSMLLQFSTKVFGCSSVKTKYRDRLSTGSDRRPCLTCFKPRIGLLMSVMQARPLKLGTLLHHDTISLRSEERRVGKECRS